MAARRRDDVRHDGNTGEKRYNGVRCMMTPRLLEMRRVMKPNGSIYLHCNSTANAYLRIMLNAVFGPERFRNEIFWYYYNKMHDRRKKLFPRATDTISFYVNDINSDFVFHQLKEKRRKRFVSLPEKKSADTWSMPETRKAI